MSASYQKPVTFDFIVKLANQTAIDTLAAETGLSKQRIKDVMNKGACWWTIKGKQLRLRRATKPLEPGTRIQLYYDEQVLARTPEPGELIHDAARYSIWYKPHGMLAQGSQWGDHCSLLRWVEVNTKRNCFLIHRLDADAAGLMMIAHDPQAAALLSQLFQGRTMHKEYQAWVVGELNETARRLEMPLDGKESISEITTLYVSEDKQSTLLNVKIETGRKHQIRRHLSAINHPIIGDRVYGTPHKNPLQLLAYRLEFVCPVSKQSLKIVLPEDMQFNSAKK
jgi:tRNA pseudouridine32 synthase/23S rRNA pseudouridine746 synthase